MVLDIVKGDKLAQMHAELCKLESRCQWTTQAREHWAEEAEITAFLSARVVRHIPPPVQLGQARASLGHKFQAILHAYLLLTGSVAHVAALLQSTVSWLSDYGTEVALSRILPVGAQAVFPYLCSPDSDHVPHPAVPEPNFSIDPEVEEPEEPDFNKALACFLHTSARICTEHPAFLLLTSSAESSGRMGTRPMLHGDNCPCLQRIEDVVFDLTGSLEVPGLLHILHNCGDHLQTHLCRYAEIVTRLSKLVMLLSGKEAKQEKSSPAASLLWRDHLRHFRSTCHDKRWGTISASVLALTDEVGPIGTWMCTWTARASAMNRSWSTGNRSNCRSHPSLSSH